MHLDPFETLADPSRRRIVEALRVLTAPGDRVIVSKVGGKKVVLGTDRDVKAVTNSKGDYCLYFNRGDITAVTLSASLANYVTKSRTLTVVTGGRNRADIFLERS